jgi:hypothetical protein
MGDEQHAVEDDKLLRRLCVSGLVAVAAVVVVVLVVVVLGTPNEQAMLFLRRWTGFTAALVTARVEAVESSHMGEEHILFRRRAGFLGANDSKVAVAAAATTFREEKLLRRSSFPPLPTAFGVELRCRDDECCNDPSMAFR